MKKFKINLFNFSNIMKKQFKFFKNHKLNNCCHLKIKIKF